MGSCLSKKSACASSSALPKPPEKLKSDTQFEKKIKTEEENVVKKEIFIIKHREIERPSDDEKVEPEREAAVEKGRNVISGGGGVPVRTSSCTKEEVDAILIQCGRLSRSSSAGKAAVSSESGGRKYSGSKRSYDFDGENLNNAGEENDDEAVARERENRRRERHRHSQGRRRTPSRERERDSHQKQRSGSRERSGGGGRRVSRSPNRRSESPITSTNTANSNPSAAVNAISKPGKMVSVPATISSSLGGGRGEANGPIKRIQVKRNVGGDISGARSGASPRARSPARMRASNENQNVNVNQNQTISLSRSNSRKAEHSPFRRNPLAEIDTNIISQKPNGDYKTAQATENRNNTTALTTTKDQKPTADETHIIPTHVALNIISSSAPENLKNQLITRTRSSRLSRDLDNTINPETLSSNPNTSSYTALLLEDIHNFHQKNTTTTPPPTFTLPPCVTKACSILEAVADLNSSTGSNADQMNNKIKRTKPEITTKDPILESEIVANDDLTEPSFHKYVTVRRGGSTSGGDHDLDGQESSGSNSFAGSQQFCWEPNSAESTDRWASSSSSRSITTRQAVIDESGKKASGSKKRDCYDQNGIGRGRIGTRSSSTHVACNAAVSS